MTTLKLNVYDKEGKITKTCESAVVDLEFGTIRSIMEVLKIEEINTTTGMLKLLYDAWNEVIDVLNKAFPDMEYEDWQHVKLKELMPMLVDILKYSFGEILTIPRDEKN